MIENCGEINVHLLVHFLLVGEEEQRIIIAVDIAVEGLNGASETDFVVVRDDEKQFDGEH